MNNLKQVDEIDKVEELKELKEADFEENNEELVEKVYELKVGMSFNSPNEISEHYKAYGLQEGFPVMQRFCRNENDGSLRYVTFTCR